MKFLKRLTLIVLILPILLALGMFFAPTAVHAAGSIYSATVSTFPVTETTLTPAINRPGVRIRGVFITNGTTAQTITMYQNTTSTTTARAVCSWDVPGTAGFYYPFGYGDIGENAAPSISYPAFRSSTNTASGCKITVLWN